MHIVELIQKCIFNGRSSFYNLRGFIKFCLKIYYFVVLIPLLLSHCSIENDENGKNVFFQLLSIHFVTFIVLISPEMKNFERKFTKTN